MHDHSIKPVKQVAANTVKAGNLYRRCRQMVRRAFAKCYPDPDSYREGWRRSGRPSRWFVALVVALADLASGGDYRRER